MKFVYLDREHEQYKAYGDLCIDQVVKENLIENGGTLAVLKAIFYSEFVIIAMAEETNQIFGFLAMRYIKDRDGKPGLYINQIAVKKALHRHGIGRELINKLIASASSDILCDVRSFNISSMALFEAMGFVKEEDRSSPNNNHYRRKYDEPKKEEVLS